MTVLINDNGSRNMTDNTWREVRLLADSGTGRVGVEAVIINPKSRAGRSMLEAGQPTD